MLLLLIGLATGCDLEVYRTNGGVGVTGPTDSFFIGCEESVCSVQWWFVPREGR
jgi:hypothetical protein